jgi:hypothetical protein
MSWPACQVHTPMLDDDQQSGMFSKAMRRLLDDEEVNRVLGTRAGPRRAQQRIGQGDEMTIVALR